MAEQKPVAGIIVLSGTFSGQKSPGAHVQVAIQLAQRFLRARVVFSGMEETAGTAGANAAQMFVAAGIGPKRIMFEGRSRFDELKKALAERQRGDESGEHGAHQATLAHPQVSFAPLDQRTQSDARAFDVVATAGAAHREVAVSGHPATIYRWSRGIGRLMTPLCHFSVPLSRTTQYPGNPHGSLPKANSGAFRFRLWAWELQKQREK